ncbi:LysE family translocator [Clostridium transplantifaecale]|uniref:LysE family translocator n=1 Tax=Clostridium transplantifaecale TaxID=2479838 RepID=UPI000F63F62C|nr:LysE family transporter [Clostridium transplantifaecale]
MLENYLMRGFIIGIVFGVPAGAVGILSIQRVLSRGAAAGFVTGLGSSVADVFYACVGVFGITVISDFLLRHQHLICMVGCLAVILLGIQCFKKKKIEKPADFFQKVQDEAKRPGGFRYLVSCFLSSFVIAITNPAAILSFMVVFSMFRIGGTETVGEDIQLVLGIFCGTCFWWLLIAVVVSCIRKRVTDNFYLKLNRIFGILMVLFGAGIGVRALLI